MAKKIIRNSQGEEFKTQTSERISTEFDRTHDVRDTFTFRMINNIKGIKDDTVRLAIAMVLKRAGASSSNIKIRFTQSFANAHFEDFVSLAKTVQLENEARIIEVREGLSEADKKNGKRIAYQNYALMLLKSMVVSTVSEENLNLALSNTGSWFTPDSAVFTLKLDFAGVTPEKSGLRLEKEIEVTDSNGVSDTAYRIITEVGGMKSCPVTAANKDKMADMLFDILKLYDESFKDVKGDKMDDLLEALKKYVAAYRKHDNKELEDTRLSTKEKADAKAWAEKARLWLAESIPNRS